MAVQATERRKRNGGARELGQMESQTGDVLVDIDEGCGPIWMRCRMGVRRRNGLEAASGSGNSGETKSEQLDVLYFSL